MGDLYVNATTGMDAPGRGTTLSDPLRTVTFAVNEAVTRFGAALSTVHVAAGTYNEALGEEYPVLLPQNISLFGAGSDQTFLRMERDFGMPWTVCMQGGREITGIALVGTPLAVGSCRVTQGILLQQDGTYIHDVTISGFAGDDFGFGEGISISSVAARIERVQVSECERAVAASTDAAAGVRCSIRESRFNVAGMEIADFVGEISDNHFDSCNDVAIRAYSALQPSDVSILRNHFRGCRAAVYCEPDPPPASMPFFRVTVSHNTFVDVQFGIDVFTRVDLIVSNNTFELSDPSAIAVRVGGSRSRGYAISPVLKNNIMSKTVADPRVLIQPLVEINDGHSPILEGNSLGMAGPDGEPIHGAPTISIFRSATANLGGGVGRRRSAGRNRFVTGGIQIASSEPFAPRTISARDNYWRHVPPNVVYEFRALHSLWGDIDIDPRGGPVTVDVDGAMSL
jgi:Protein of unknown function (DUF1565)